MSRRLITWRNCWERNTNSSSHYMTQMSNSNNYNPNTTPPNSNSPTINNNPPTKTPPYQHYKHTLSHSTHNLTHSQNNYKHYKQSYRRRRNVVVRLISCISRIRDWILVYTRNWTSWKGCNLESPLYKISCVTWPMITPSWKYSKRNCQQNCSKHKLK